MNFKYIGVTDEDYTNGKYYKFVYCGLHWCSRNPVIWIAYNEYPNTDDVDCCISFDLIDFMELFEI